MDIFDFLRSIKSKGLIEAIRKTRSARQFVKYFLVGLLAAGIEYGLTLGLTECFGVWFIISSSIGMTAGLITSFLLNRSWSFKSKGSIIKQFTLHILLFIINLGVTNAILYVLTTYVGIVYFISKVFVMGIAVLWNFYLYKTVIYKK